MSPVTLQELASVHTEAKLKAPPMFKVSLLTYKTAPLSRIRSPGISHTPSLHKICEGSVPLALPSRNKSLTFDEQGSAAVSVSTHSRDSSYLNKEQRKRSTQPVLSWPRLPFTEYFFC